MADKIGPVMYEPWTVEGSTVLRGLEIIGVARSQKEAESFARAHNSLITSANAHIKALEKQTKKR